MAAVEVIGVVLAAGDGRRMGGSKALLVVDGEPLATLHARRFVEAGCARVVIAVRPGVVSKLEPQRGVSIVPSCATDPAGSLQVALCEASLGQGALVVITPVDAMPASTAIVRALLGALVGGIDAATPRCGGKGGHPIVCRAEVLEPYRSPTPPPLRQVLRALGARRAYVDVDDPAVLFDLDTPADVVAHTGDCPHFVG